jgi:hypothetical protein
MKLIIILIDIILTLIFFPLVSFFNSNFDLNRIFINFSFLHITPKNSLYGIFTNMRGKNYQLCGIYKENQPHYFITTWVLLHILYYFLRGIIIPNLFFYNLMYSIIFELYESITDCHDIMDIFINIIFYHIGSKISKMVF